jgi:hypothetical protein
MDQVKGPRIAIVINLEKGNRGISPNPGGGKQLEIVANGWFRWFVVANRIV